MDEPPGNSASLLIAGQAMDSVFCISVVAGLVLIWFVIVTVEAALFSLSADDLNKLSQRRTTFDVIALWLLNYPQQVQLSNLIVRWAIKVSVVTIVVLLLRNDIASAWIALITGALVSMVILTGEVLAKYLAQQRRMMIVRIMSPVMVVIVVLLTPVALPLITLQTFAVKFFGDRRTASEKAATRLLQETLNASVPKEARDKTPHPSLATVSVKQLMKPGHGVTAIEIGSDFEALLDSINHSGYSRIPIYRTTPDKIEGVIYIKDLIPFLEQQRGFEWRKLMRPAYFVPETTMLTTLLREFQQKHIQMALVVDRFGRISGMVTLHDLIEEVIGDINEQFNTLNPGG